METFSEFDHCVINVNDIPLALHFYADIMGEILGDAKITDMSFMSIEEVLYAQQQSAKRAELQPIAGSLPTPHTGVRFGEALLPIFLHQEHVQEPPPEQLVGTPRLALPVSQEQLTKAIAVLTREGVPFKGPIDYPAPCPAERSLYFKDPSSNFLELSVPRAEGAPFTS
jgi:catechol 2,3-dioxygenase-like lactoylglutathione lyase family enzyme